MLHMSDDTAGIKSVLGVAGASLLVHFLLGGAVTLSIVISHNRGRSLADTPFVVIFILGLTCIPLFAAQVLRTRQVRWLFMFSGVVMFLIGIDLLAGSMLFFSIAGPVDPKQLLHMFVIGCAMLIFVSERWQIPQLWSKLTRSRRLDLDKAQFNPQIMLSHSRKASGWHVSYAVIPLLLLSPFIMILFRNASCGNGRYAVFGVFAFLGALLLAWVAWSMGFGISVRTMLWEHKSGKRITQPL